VFFLALIYTTQVMGADGKCDSKCETDPMFYSEPLLTKLNPKEIWVCVGEKDTQLCILIL